MDYKRVLKKAWHFIWHEDSFLSWLANIALAFVLIKFIVYPGLGWILDTSHPVVAVVSESMEHNVNFEKWWQNSGWYQQNGISKDEFASFKFEDGFNKGDIMVLKGKSPENIQVGDIIVFWSLKKDPIIHRVVAKWQEDGKWHFRTKGDNYKTNPVPIQNIFLDETDITEDRIVGTATLRIPFLGYVKIWFVELLNALKFTN